MSAFVTKVTAVYEFESPDNPGQVNKIFYRGSRMPFGVEAAMQKDLMEMRISSQDGASPVVVFSAMGQHMAILKHNVFRWLGPWFKDETGQSVKFSAEALERIDYDLNAFWIQPLVDILNDINTDTVADQEVDPETGEPADFLPEEAGT